MKKYYFLLLCLCSLFTAIAQTVPATLIDLNSESGLAPKFFCAGTSKVYFSGNAFGMGSELYVLDTSTNQINFVKDINPGYGSGPNGSAYLTVGDILYFTADSNNFSDSELWRSDGTEAGTYKVKDINPNGSSYITKMVYYNNKLIFNAQNNTYGNELWASDGTEAGTNLIVELVPGVGSFLSGDIVEANGMVYFTAGTTATGRELWKTDGTAAGTALVKDVAAGPTSSIDYDTRLTVMNNHVYFLANDGVHGRELWKSDGTEAGTLMVKDIFVGSGAAAYEWHGAATDSYIAFMAYTPTTGYALWKTDGTESGTSLVMDINPSTDGFLNPQSFVPLNGKIYFTETDGTGEELWVTNGITSGTHVVKEIGDASNYIENVTAVNGYLLFTANGTSDYPTIWKSDGTEPGTAELIHMNVDLIASVGFVPYNDTVFFSGYDESHGNELWTTNGTSSGTQLLEDFDQASSSTPQSFTELNGQLLFTAIKGGFRQLYKSDGTAANTIPVKTPNISPDAVYATDPVFTNIGNTVFFEGYNSVSGKELCKSDGSAQNTLLVKDIVPGNSSSFPQIVNLRNTLNGIYYFTAFNAQYGTELWRSDGTEAGTSLVKDINPGNADGFDYNMVNSAVLNGNLYFTANDGTSPAIWKTDGTDSGTVKVITIPNNFNYYSKPQVLAVIGNMLFFSANINNSSYGNQSLWVSDGTQAGSALLQSFNNNSSISRSIVYNNELYYTGPYSPFGGGALFKSNGTIAGTFAVNNSQVGYIHSLKVCGSYLYFSTNGTLYDDNLFRTDGSATGTVQLEGNTIGASMHDYECVQENLLYLKSSGYIVGHTDGNTAGEFNFNITNAENFSGYNLIENLGHLGSKLFFNARTDQHGEELYVSDMQNVLAVHTPQAAPISGHYLVSYPNPTSGMLNVSTADGSLLQQLSIYDLYGKRLLSTDALKYSVQVNMSEFSKGIYLVAVKTETGVYTSKVILK